MLRFIGSKNNPLAEVKCVIQYVSKKYVCCPFIGLKQWCKCNQCHLNNNKKNLKKTSFIHLVPSAPAALEEEAEGEDEEPTAELKKTVDEPEDKKEEDDEDDDDEEKATVDVIKPVPEPEEAAPTGQRATITAAVIITHSPSLWLHLCALWFQCVPVCTLQRPPSKRRPPPRL